ncbi:MAG: hypothetical protein PVH05_08840 [Burkholderiales bacterium]
MNRFFAHFLFILAAWTIVIKYVFPIAYAIHEDLPWATYVYLDLWPVVHLALGWALITWPRYTFEFAVGVSVAEIAIVLTKFFFFLVSPEWTIWRTNWFINKIFVLGCFVMLLTWLLFNTDTVKALRSGSPGANNARSRQRVSGCVGQQ